MLSWLLADAPDPAPLRRSWKQPWKKPKQEQQECASAVSAAAAPRPLVSATLAGLRQSIPDALTAASDAVEACGTPRAATADRGASSGHLTPRGGGKTPRGGASAPGAGSSPFLRSLQV